MAHVSDQPENVAYLTLFYDDNLIAHIHVNWLSPVKIRQTLIGGDKKMLVYDDLEPTEKVKIYDKGIDRMAVLGDNMDFDNPSTFSFNHRYGDVIMPEIKWIEPLKTEIAHFVDCIQNGTKCLTDVTHAAKVVKILEQSS